MSRELILEAVVDLLEANGLEGASMPAIAQASGVSLRSLYRYFPTREELLGEAGAHIQDRMGLSDAVCSAADIPRSFWANSARAARHPRLARALVVTSAGRSARAPTRSKRVAAIEQAMKELTGPLPKDRAQQAASVITHLCSSSSWITISEESGVSPLQARRSVMWALETLLASLHDEVQADRNADPHVRKATTRTDKETGP